MASLIEVEKKNSIGIVTINNPPMNVLSYQVTKELYEAFTALESDKEVIVVILTGAGDRAFMAGADIKEFPIDGKEDKYAEGFSIQSVFKYIESLSKPVIALINGYTLGAGLELTLTCDIRIAEEHAVVGLPEVKLGILPGAGGTQRLPRIIGSAKAKEMMFGGEALTAEEALAIGLVSKVVSKGEGMVAALKLAKSFSGHSIQALSKIKKLINQSEELSLEKGLTIEEKQFNELLKTKDAKEGITAFIEKRKAKFTHE